MGIEVERKEGEAWADYVQRSAHLCRETMNREQQAWEANPEYAHLVLCFCLTAPPPEEELALHGMKNPFAQEGKSGSAIALSFDEFEFVDLAFHLPVGIDQR